MTFVSDAPGPAPILWITGLSGVGKTTLARAVVAALRGQGEYFDFAVEAGGEIRDDYEVYDGRLVARFLF